MIIKTHPNRAAFSGPRNLTFARHNVELSDRLSFGNQAKHHQNQPELQ